MIFILPFLGILVGFISGFFGIGGGTVVVPVMLALGYNIKFAAGISVLQMLFSSIFGSYVNYKNKKLMLDSGIFVGIGGIFGASLCGLIVSYLNEKYLEIGLLITLAISIIKMFKTNVNSSSDKDISKIAMFFIGFAIGAIAISMGVGGAIFLTPILVGFFGVDIKKAVSMGLFFVVFSSFSGFISLALSGYVKYFEGILLGIGGIIGVYFGTKTSHKIDKNLQKKCLLILYIIMFLLTLKKIILN